MSERKDYYAMLALRIEPRKSLVTPYHAIEEIVHESDGQEEKLQFTLSDCTVVVKGKNLTPLLREIQQNAIAFIEPMAVETGKRGEAWVKSVGLLEPPKKEEPNPLDELSEEGVL